MAKNTVKLILWVLILSVSGGAIFGSVYGIGALLTYFNTGADPASALNIVPNVVPDWPVSVEWMEDDQDTGREMEPFTRSQIENAYIRAWLQQGFSYTKQEPFGLKTYFTGPALAMVEENVLAASQQDLLISQVATGHRLQLHYYSADGTVVAFTDREARIAHHVTDPDGNEVLAEEDVAAYQVVMLIDDGLWKVRHWLRQDLDRFGRDREPGEEALAVDEPLVTVDPLTGQFLLDGESFTMRGINYYPQDTPWLEMWELYDGKVIDDDFALISSIGLNTIRIFVPYELFGEHNIEESEYNRYIQLLRDTLNTAWEHDLRVVVTLFDFKGEYGLLEWPKTDRHVEAIVTTFRHHPAILAWDIKNKPDLDYEHAGEALVNAWLKHTLDAVKRYDPNHLVTIGWSNPDVAGGHAEAVDFVSYHYYGEASELLGRMSALQIEVGPDKPLILGEFGQSTWNSYLFPNGQTDEEQANYYAEVIGLLEENEMAGFIAWTLYDFTHVPSSVTGRLPWNRQPQGEMGIIRADGTLKPAGRFLLPDASYEAPYELGVLDRITKPFYITMASAMVLMTTSTLLLIIYLWATGRFQSLRLRKPELNKTSGR